MDDNDIGKLLGLGLLAAAALSAWAWVSANGKWIGRTAGAWWASWAWLIAVVVMSVLVLLIVRAVLRRRYRWRRDQWVSLGEATARLMPADWPKEGLRVRRWRGTSPRAVDIRVSLSSSTTDTEWRVQMRKLLVSRMGPVSISWPGDDHKSRRKPRWINAVSQPAEEAGESGSKDKLTPEGIESELAGLVPAAKVTINEGVIEVAYGPTTRDQSEIWRGRVVEQISARTQSRYRASWDRRTRTLRLDPVPEFGGPIDWKKSIEKFQALSLSDRYVPYGIDEDGHWVAWNVGPQAPHSIGAGKTGAGKSETTKSVIQTWLLLGGLVAIIDPKRQDFAEFRGRPGVLAVATTLSDRLALLRALRDEMHRRNAAAELRKLLEDNPDLAGDVPRVSEEQRRLDQVRVLIVIDELTQHRKEAEAWVRGLSKDEKAVQADVLGIPGEFAQLARAVSMHLLVSMQRGDAGNFGDSTQMRDNLPHVFSMGQLSAIGSEMAWGDRLTGSTVVVGSTGEGMSNGLRISAAGEILQMGVPGRFKAFYSQRDAREPELWARVAEVAPDASRIDLGEVSMAARDVKAALQALQQRAYAGVAQDVDAGGGDPSVTHDVATHGPSEAAPPIPPVSPPSDESDGRPQQATDLAGRTWEEVRVTDLEVGDVVSLADLECVEVVQVSGWGYDEFNGDRVFGITVLDGGTESVLDLSDEEVLLRLS